MIAALRGNIIQKNPGSLVLDVAGVGYEVLVSLRTWETLPELNREVQDITHRSPSERTAGITSLRTISRESFHILMSNRRRSSVIVVSLRSCLLMIVVQRSPS